MPAGPAASPIVLERPLVGAALKARMPRLVLTSLVLGAITFAALSMVTPRYRSDAELAIGAKSSAAGGKLPAAVISAHVQALQSADLLAKVASDLKLAKKPEFNSAAGYVDRLDQIKRIFGLGGPRRGEAESDRVIARLRQQLEVYAANKSNVVAVRATSIDPAFAAAIANGLIEAYRASLASQSASDTAGQQSALQAKIDKLTPDVKTAEADLERYRGSLNALLGQAEASTFDAQQMQKLTSELQKATAARGDADARAQTAREMLADGSAESLEEVQKSPLIQNLTQQRVTLERQLAELSATLLPRHPRMQQISADLAGVTKQLTSEVSKVVDSLDRQAKAAAVREARLKKSIDALKPPVIANAPDAATLRVKETHAKALRGELEKLQTELDASRQQLAKAAPLVDLQTISKAQPSLAPASAKIWVMSALVGFGFLLLATAWVMARVAFSSRRGAMTPDAGRLEKPGAFDGLKPAATLPAVLPAKAATKTQPMTSAPPIVAANRTEPTLPAPGKITNPVKLAEPLQSVAQQSAPADQAPRSIEDLAKRLASNRPTDTAHRTLMTGESDAIDASVEAVELVRILANGGAHVVLVDWSMSGSGASDATVASKGAGIAELLAGSARFDEIVRLLPGSDAHVIGCGADWSKLGVKLDADQINMALDALDESYEHVIVTGRTEASRALFEVIQGRFDAGIRICEPKRRQPVLTDSPDMFLGFEVTDIDVIDFQRVVAASAIGGTGTALPTGVGRASAAH